MSIFRDRILDGKTALVTGGGSGIGQRMAERFAEHGAKVMLVGRKQEKLDAAAATIRERGGTAATHATDVRDYPGVQAAVVSASPVNLEGLTFWCAAPREIFRPRC